MLLTSRRAFLGGLLSALAAPAIVHAGNIMPVRNVIILPSAGFDSFDRLMPAGMQYQWVGSDFWYKSPEGRNGWQAVPALRHKANVEIFGDTIQVGGMTLVERPKAVCEAARAKEINEAHRLTKRWAERCMANGFEGGVRYTQPTTVDFTRLSDFGATS